MLPHKSPVNSGVAAAPIETITTNTTISVQLICLISNPVAGTAPAPPLAETDDRVAVGVTVISIPV
jgi:hypothetical protein